MPMDKTQQTAQRARARIPGGTQLLSKRPEMFAPGQWPGYYARAKGAEVWDLDGRRYLDMSLNGIAANVLGFADPDVDAAVRAAIEAGQTSTLNCPEEVELAELLCELHPWADMVRYTRAGGEAMALAVRLARAHTGRDRVAFCGYHGWHDWYLAANLARGSNLDGHLLPGLEPAGVPRALAGTAVPFQFNRPEELDAIAAEDPRGIAAIVLEPARSHEPAPGFLRHVRKVADELGAVLIYDEVSAGFRMTNGGIHLRYGVPPDVAVLAKAMSNGYPMAAVLGREPVMQAAQRSFISSTSWTDRIGPAASLATIRKFRERDVARHLVTCGQAVQRGWTEAAKSAGLPVAVGGIPPLSHFGFEGPQALAMMTLFTQGMLARGYLASGGYNATLAHGPEHIEGYLAAARGVFAEVADAARKGDVEARLKGPVKHGGFRRLA